MTEENDRAGTAGFGSKLGGRVALVTGGTRGIGAAISRSLANQGATVAAGYGRDKEHAEQFLAEIQAEGVKGSIHQGNIGVGDDCRRVVAEVIAEHGSLDILINNAGITIDKTVLNLTDSDWEKVLAVNLSGAFFLSQAALAHMIERGTGRIVNVSSIIGEVGNIGQANYAASKSGLFGLTKTLAKEAAFMLQRAGKLDEQPDRHHGEHRDAWIRRDRDDRDGAGEGVAADHRPDPGSPPRPPGGDRQGRALPGLRCRRLHHRAGLGRQRRDGHVGPGPAAHPGPLRTDRMSGVAGELDDVVRPGAGCAASRSSRGMRPASRSRSSWDSAASCCSSQSSLTRTNSVIRWAPIGVICTRTCRPSRGFSKRCTRFNDSRPVSTLVIDGGRTCSLAARSPAVSGPSRQMTAKRRQLRQSQAVRGSLLAQPAGQSMHREAEFGGKRGDVGHSCEASAWSGNPTPERDDSDKNSVRTDPGPA